MEFEYELIVKRVMYMQEQYSLGNSGTHFTLISLLNKIGKDGWELVGSVEGQLIVKRKIS